MEPDVPIIRLSQSNSKKMFVLNIVSWNVFDIFFLRYKLIEKENRKMETMCVYEAFLFIFFLNLLDLFTINKIQLGYIELA